MIFNSLFSNSPIFYGTFSITNNSIPQKNALLKTDENITTDKIFFESKIILNKVVTSWKL